MLGRKKIFAGGSSPVAIICLDNIDIDFDLGKYVNGIMTKYTVF